MAGVLFFVIGEKLPALLGFVVCRVLVGVGR